MALEISTAGSCRHISDRYRYRQRWHIRFEYRTIFDTRYVITDRCFDEAASQTTCEDTCFVFVRAGDSQVGEAFQGYFFCVAGTCKDCYIFWWYTIFFFVKYSDTITLSSGTIPLIAVMINLSFILVFSFSDAPSDKERGVTKISVSDSFTTSLMLELNEMRFVSNFTPVR